MIGLLVWTFQLDGYNYTDRVRIEQEITGDVLLELDINLLKTEIGIMAFGKRMRIANAITDLRRPPSIEYSDLQTPGTFLHPHLPNTHPSGSHSRNLSHSHSHSYSYSHGYAQSVQSSGHHSFNGPSSGPFGVIMSPESAPHTGDIPGSPSPMAVALLQGPKGEGEGEGEGDRTSDGSTNAEPVEASAVGLGFGISTTASMNGRGTVSLLV